MNSKDLLNNSTVEALIPAEALGVAVEAGAIIDLKGIGRKVLVIVNAGTPAAGSTVDITVHESNAADFVADDDILHTFTQIVGKSVVEADLTPNKRYIRIEADVKVDVFTIGVDGIIYLEREIPSGI